jgi:hypothetical protein
MEMTDLNGGRFPYSTLEKSILISTALRVAAGPERLKEAARASRRFNDGGGIDVIAIELSRHPGVIRDAIAVIREAMTLPRDPSAPKLAMEALDRDYLAAIGMLVDDYQDARRDRIYDEDKQTLRDQFPSMAKKLNELLLAQRKAS